MDPLGKISEGKAEEETLQAPSHQDFEIDPQLLTKQQTQNNKAPLIKKIFRHDDNKSLRRTSSFMLRSQAEGGGKLDLKSFQYNIFTVNVI